MLTNVNHALQRTPIGVAELVVVGFAFLPPFPDLLFSVHDFGKLRRAAIEPSQLRHSQRKHRLLMRWLRLSLVRLVRYFGHNLCKAQDNF